MNSKFLKLFFLCFIFLKQTIASGQTVSDKDAKCGDLGEDIEKLAKSTGIHKQANKIKKLMTAEEDDKKPFAEKVGPLLNFMFVPFSIG